MRLILFGREMITADRIVMGTRYTTVILIRCIPIPATIQFPASWQGDLLVAYHGDWNRTAPIGFKVVRLAVRGNTIVGSNDFLTGFLQSNKASDALGRPADVAFDTVGNLYVSDDKAGAIYIIQKK